MCHTIHVLNSKEIQPLTDFSSVLVNLFSRLADPVPYFSLQYRTAFVSAFSSLLKRIEERPAVLSMKANSCVSRYFLVLLSFAMFFQSTPFHHFFFLLVCVCVVIPLFYTGASASSSFAKENSGPHEANLHSPIFSFVLADPSLPRVSFPFPFYLVLLFCFCFFVFFFFLSARSMVSFLCSACEPSSPLACASSIRYSRYTLFFPLFEFCWLRLQNVLFVVSRPKRTKIKK